MRKALRGLHHAAAAVGYLATAYFVAGVVYVNLLREHRVDPYEGAGIGAARTLAEAYSRRNPNGDGATMVVWKAFPPTDDLLTLLGRDRIERGRIWFEGPFDEHARAGFGWLSRTPQYEAVRPHVERILEGRYFYSYDRYHERGDELLNCALWLVSPERRLVAYLDYDT